MFSVCCLAVWLFHFASVSLNTIYSAIIVHGIIKYTHYIYGSEN